MPKSTNLLLDFQELFHLSPHHIVSTMYTLSKTLIFFPPPPTFPKMIFPKNSFLKWQFSPSFVNYFFLSKITSKWTAFLALYLVIYLFYLLIFFLVFEKLEKCSVRGDVNQNIHHCNLLQVYASHPNPPVWTWVFENRWINRFSLQQNLRDA